MSCVIRGAADARQLQNCYQDTLDRELPLLCSVIDDTCVHLELMILHFADKSVVNILSTVRWPFYSLDVLKSVCLMTDHSITSLFSLIQSVL